ncbi:hypothetical protein [Clostridium beijerinckii]|jgi:Zn finger protein HypA/HybF involved in hydrogenase expression|uniref:Hydrogenase nickel incorporation protein HypA n=1 Tax=Clostridium beijerinckii TaxID=1520 RepID=A0A1S9NAS4_CLOBE|nr:hypothetical protein [Clostridium beijerinckii]MDK2828356.1 hypothetical protein [Clostridium butyricum]OOP74582.1 hypothetical protein CBEIBR21_07265 [Clostridium beijerinckii]
MHDTILLSKISEELKNICATNKINKVKTFTVIVNHRSHVNENNLYDHLRHIHKNLVGEWTKINVEREDIQDQTAILKSIQGEQGEN